VNLISRVKNYTPHSRYFPGPQPRQWPQIGIIKSKVSLPNLESMWLPAVQHD